MQKIRHLLRWLLGGFFIGAGVMHFATLEFFVRIVPPYLPWPEVLVAISGVVEVAFGALVFVPRYASLAGWGLVALLVTVFPANVHMALNPEAFPQFSPAVLWGRLPFQFILMAWAFWSTRPTSRNNL